MRRGRGLPSKITGRMTGEVNWVDVEPGARVIRATIPTVNCRSFADTLRSTSKARRRRRGGVRKIRLCIYFLYICISIRVLHLLATWYPGDETLRAFSESPIKLMFSRSGISFGTWQAFHFAGEIKIDAEDSAIRQKKRAYMVQGDIVERPKWSEELNVTQEAVVALEPPPPLGVGRSCFFRVHHDEAKITFYDDGRVIINALEIVKSPRGVTDHISIDDLLCVHFRAMTKSSHQNLLTQGIQVANNVSATSDNNILPQVPDVIPDSTSGRVLMLNSATTLEMLSEYHRTLLNHQAYAEHHHYGLVLALVKAETLAGRSGKFAKHLALGVHAAQTYIPGRVTMGLAWNTICHMAGIKLLLLSF